MLKERLITTDVPGYFIPLGENVDEVTICVHSDTPVRFHLDFYESETDIGWWIGLLLGCSWNCPSGKETRG